ncbi:thioredoxin-disulfide reductase [Candidatus Woesearchaeota archaeon]|nr:thioredoxin-disulfide reductase [Candidatus Woesearchaeota archaeon]
MVKKEYDVVIIGSGPAGLCASIYSIRANLSTIVISGVTPGGQLMLTTDVEDYPGFPGGIQGPELMQRMIEQAKKLNVDFLDEDVTKVNLKGKIKKSYVGKQEISSKVVIIATGSSAKWLGLKSEKRLTGRGVSACAVCDGAFFKDKDVAVIGGGDTALRETLFLAKICKTVTVVHRRDELRAQKILQDRSFKTKNVKFIWNSEVEEFIGSQKLEAIKLKDVKTNKLSELKVSGAFVAIGHTPNTKFLDGSGIELHGPGYIKVHDNVKTDVEGVFAAGDVHDYRYMQAVTAAGAGCMSAMEADSYIENLKHKK